MTVYLPNGDYLDGAYVNQYPVPGAKTSMRLALPIRGNYLVRLTPIQNAGNSRYALRVLNDVDTVTDLTLDVTRTISMNTPGKSALINIQAPPGKRVMIQLGASSISEVKIDNYDRLWVKSPALSCSENCADVLIGPIDVSVSEVGIYHLIVVPGNRLTGNIAVRAYLAPDPLTSTISIDGPSVTLTSTAPGQAAVLLFTARADELLNLSVVREPITQWRDRTHILAPNGVLVCSSLAGCALPQRTPVSGRYRIVVDPGIDPLATIRLTLSRVITGGILTIDGPPTTINLAREGQVADLTFSGAAGQVLNLRVTSTLPISGVATEVLDPSGAWLVQSYKSLPSYNSFGPLPYTGNYKLRISAGNGRMGAYSVTLSSVAAPTQTLIKHGPLLTLTVQP